MFRTTIRASQLAFLFAGVILALSCGFARAAGVTLITHGFNGNVAGWVTGMGNKIAQYPGFPGAASLYRLAVSQPSASTYTATASFLDGAEPAVSDSGEIILLLDWSVLSQGGTPSTEVARAAGAALMNANLIAEMNGRALAELPLHLIGHSRGASVVLELARVLGEQGVWVDHVTTLDPVPVSGFGDPPVRNYANILFIDNYWQDIGGFLVPVGQAISGAYNRKLLSLSGGYSSPHSDAHLWYHGTADLATPTSDTEASLGSTQRSTWWTALENFGTNAGYHYSRIGGGNRLSALEPAGAGAGRIRDGFNQYWDLGAGVAPNRVALPLNNGSWPNLARLTLTGTNVLVLGQPISVAFHYQVGTATGTAAMTLHLDTDCNPMNGAGPEISNTALVMTGTNAVGFAALSVPLNSTAAQPGVYRLAAKVSNGNRSRWLYAPGVVQVLPDLSPPLLFGARVEGGFFRAQVQAAAGQPVRIDASTNLVHWIPVLTNLNHPGAFQFSDTPSAPARMYRAVLLP